MFASVVLLAGLLSAADAPASQGGREVVVDFGGGGSFVFVLPAKDAQDYRVAIAPGLRVVVPPLGPARPATKQDQQQVFSFYVGLFGR